MNPKTTFILLLLAVALGAGMLVLEQRVPTTRARMEADAKMLEFDESRLDHIEIGLAEGKSFVLRKTDSVWRVSEPYDDVADPERVARLIHELKELQLVERIKRAEFSDSAWRATGLDNPAAKFRLMAGAEKLTAFWLGQPGAVERTLYASMEAPGNGGGREAFVLRSGLHAVLEEPTALWRDMKLLRLPAEAVTRMRLNSGDGLIEVARAPEERGEWLLTKPLQARGSRERIEDTLAAALNLDILSAELAAIPGSPAAPANGATAEPDALRVTLFAGGREYELQALQAVDVNTAEVLMTASHRRPHFKVPAEQVSRLLVKPNDLRDDHLARVDAEKVAAFGMRSAAFPELELKQENQTWLLRRQGRWEPANGERVARLFETLNQTRVREFASDSASELAPYGLDAPFLTLWWQPQDKPERVELIFGQSTDQTAFYVKNSAEPFIYRISADVLPLIPPDPLKWKGRGVLRFSQFDLKRIVLAIGAAPAVELSYDPATAVWSGRVGEQDVTPMIDRAKADAFAGTLGRFTADDWSSSLGVALQALEKPTVRIQVTLQPSGQKDAPVRVHDLKFAPTIEGQDTALYYGRLDEQPDVFYISRESLRGLLKPVFKDGATRR